MSENKIVFEKSIAKLEDIISKLESGKCSLDESIELFEKGMKCTADCRTTLETAKKRIITLTEFEKEEGEID